MNALHYTPKHAYLLCVDSDGCAFDTMGIKHKECFCPAFIEHFGLQQISGYAREAWEFVNLYSQTRGIHRLPALARAMALLTDRREVEARGFVPEGLSTLRMLLAQRGPMSNDALRAVLASPAGNDEIRRILAWSEDVNGRIARMVRGIPPFPGVKESLAEGAKHADIVVVSATPTEALEREWEEHRLTRYVSAIYGQEHGTKREILSGLRAAYRDDRMLMIGDAPGDLQAAQVNSIAFYPIRPDRETDSWAHFPAALEALFTGAYDGTGLVERFDSLLPHDPPWEAK